MRRILAVLAVVAFTGSATTPAGAQERRDRDRGLVELSPEGVRGGFFIAGGLGAGREQYKYSDEAEYTEALTKPTVTLRVGGTPSRNIRLGLELFGWAAEGIESTEDFDDPFTDSFGTAMGIVQFYPLASDGLWLKGGVGLARSERDYEDPQLLDPIENGFAWSVGVGYELQLSRSIGIGPSVEFYQGSFSRRDEPTLNERVLNIGLQLTFQTGGRRR
jgi:hypothetical protein